jgi:hypothetical protein
MNDPFVWIGLPENGAWQQGTFLVPVKVQTLYDDVRKGYTYSDPHHQLTVDFPRLIVCIDGKLVKSVDDIRAPTSAQQEILEMFMSQTSFALPYELLSRAAAPGYVIHDRDFGEKYTICMQGSCFFASVDFKMMNVHLEPQGWVRATLMIEDLYDPSADGMVLYEPLGKPHDKKIIKEKKD